MSYNVHVNFIVSVDCDEAIEFILEKAEVIAKDYGHSSVCEFYSSSCDLPDPTEADFIGFGVTEILADGLCHETSFPLPHQISTEVRPGSDPPGTAEVRYYR